GVWGGDTCTPGSPSAETCNNIDDNCNGSVDENLAGPTVITTTPGNSTTAVTLNSSVTIIWNEDVDCSTVNTVNITSNSPEWELSSCGGSHAVFTTGGQSGETTYTVTVSTAVTDVSGCSMASSYQFFYTTNSLSITEPDGTGDIVLTGNSYLITYTLNDSDNVATVSFYYDTDNTEFNGTAITGACSAAPEGTEVTCIWDTTGITPGTYYVYGIINYLDNGVTHIWTGDGADKLASTSANWSDNLVPQNGDTVIFNGTSTMDCNWDINASVHSIYINSGYKGILTVNSNMSPSEDFVIYDGTVIVRDVTIIGNSHRAYSSGQIIIE
ncbi:hypothetical protein C4544_05040, partial [candidate division WS5 bacterium]